MVVNEENSLKIVIQEENTIIRIGNAIAVSTSTMTVNKFILENYDTSLEIYAPDGITLVAKIDANGNLGLKGQIYTI